MKNYIEFDFNFKEKKLFQDQKWRLLNRLLIETEKTESREREISLLGLPGFKSITKFYN